MKVTVQQIADLLGGEVLGNSDLEITHPTKIEEGKEFGIAFLANMKYEDFLYTTNASAVLVSKRFQPKRTPNTTLIYVDDAYGSFVKILSNFNEKLFTERGISEQAFVHPSAVIEDDVYIGPFAVIDAQAHIKSGSYLQSNVYIGKHARVGENCSIYAGVSVYHYCVIGSHTIIHSNAVIGSDGFGFAPKKDGSYEKIPQVGNVVIGSNVEIGANATIDRATMGSTIIEDGVKLDNLVQVAHNVVVGKNSVLAAQVGIAGSTKLGERIVVGGQAGFAGHISVANGTKINGKSGIAKTVTEENTALSGNPATAWRDDLKSQMFYRKLPEFEQRLRTLEKQIQINDSE